MPFTAKHSTAMKSAHDLVVAAKKLIHEIPVSEAATALARAAFLLDVREADEYAGGHLAGAINIPRGLLEFKLSSLPEMADRTQPFVLYCKTSGRAALAALSMQSMGYMNVVSLDGGYDAWVSAGQPVIKPDQPSFE